MKLTHYLVPVAFMATATTSQAATVSANIHDITVNTTQDYVFTEAGIGSITLRAVYTATNNGAAAGAFTSLDGGTHIGNNADGAGDAGNHFKNDGANAEGFDVTISLLSADAGVDTSSIQFSFDQLGVRALGASADFTWSSSATAAATTNATGDNLQTLDSSTYGSISTTAYTGSWSMGTNGHFIQLSNSVAGSNGIEMTATFNAVPEPSSTALLGLGGLALILRRRK